MADDTPISYLALERGTPVLDADGARFGTVEHVLSDDDLDLFDGVVVEAHGGRRFLDASSIGTITESAVRTSLSADEASHLPEPDGDAVLTAEPDQNQGPGLTAWFGRLFLRDHWMRDTRDDA